MSASLEWNGLSELSREIAALPATVRATFKPAVVAGAERIVARTQAEYAAQDVASLGQGMRVQASDDPSEISARIRVTAPTAHLRELGTVDRYTAAGAFRGRMPARPVFIPIVIDEREQVGRELEQKLREIPVTTLAVR